MPDWMIGFDADQQDCLFACASSFAPRHEQHADLLLAGTPSVCIVDIDETARTSIRALLEVDGFALRDYALIEQFLEDEILEIDCLIVDFHGQSMNALQVLQEVARRKTHSPTMFISRYGNVDLAVQAMKSGAIDFITKPMDHEDIRVSVRSAAAISQRRRGLVRRVRTAEKLLATLTPRERQVLDLFVSGQSSRDAARHLGISPRTVELYRARIKWKFKTNNLVGAIKAVVIATHPGAASVAKLSTAPTHFKVISSITSTNRRGRRQSG